MAHFKERKKKKKKSVIVKKLSQVIRWLEGWEFSKYQLDSTGNKFSCYWCHFHLFVNTVLLLVILSVTEEWNTSIVQVSLSLPNWSGRLIEIVKVFNIPPPPKKLHKKLKLLFCLDLLFLD